MRCNLPAMFLIALCLWPMARLLNRAIPKSCSESLSISAHRRFLNVCSPFYHRGLLFFSWFAPERGVMMQELNRRSFLQRAGQAGGLIAAGGSLEALLAACGGNVSTTP